MSEKPKHTLEAEIKRLKKELRLACEYLNYYLDNWNGEHDTREQLKDEIQYILNNEIEG